MTIELFKKRVRQGSPALPMDSILDYLLGHYHGLGTVYSPANIVSYLSASDASSIVNALNCLCGEPYSLLERHWTFFDQQTGNTFEIIDTEIDSALSTQEFFHPVNGVLVPNFWNYIGLSYTSTEEFERLFSEQKKKLIPSTDYLRQ